MIKVASFLSDNELESVKNALSERRIEYFASSKGTVPGRYHDPYYQISVSVKDYFVARKVVARIIAKGIVESRKCPKCGTLDFKAIEKSNWWQRIYYFGTTRVQCKKCKTKYVV